MCVERTTSDSGVPQNEQMKSYYSQPFVCLKSHIDHHVSQLPVLSAPVGLQDVFHDLYLFPGLPQDAEHQHLLGRDPGHDHPVHQDIEWDLDIRDGQLAEMAAVFLLARITQNAKGANANFLNFYEFLAGNSPPCHFPNDSKAHHWDHRAFRWYLLRLLYSTTFSQIKSCWECWTSLAASVMRTLDIAVSCFSHQKYSDGWWWRNATCRDISLEYWARHNMYSNSQQLPSQCRGRITWTAGNCFIKVFTMTFLLIFQYSGCRIIPLFTAILSLHILCCFSQILANHNYSVNAIDVSTKSWAVYLLSVISYTSKSHNLVMQASVYGMHIGPASFMAHMVVLQTYCHQKQLFFWSFAH